MKLYQKHANTGKLIENIKTRKYINTCNMMYHSVTEPFSQFRIYNFNTDIDEYLNTRELKKQKQINVFFKNKTCCWY